YRWSADVSVYLGADSYRRGIGRALYAQLLPAVAALGYVTAFAGIALPNEASVALHETLGFALSGIERGVGFKRGRWIDVGRWQKDLAPRTAVPAAPLPYGKVRHPGVEPRSDFSSTA
ncbi:MAG TPA: GNAT family N-acetyltransferase, partial [Sphingomicrobium sp.]|nr:GNAT family N-acetyltransferase [Sphingomicrobium sp.]